MDERIRTLAEGLVHYSCQVKTGDKVYIHYTGASTRKLAKELVRAVYRAGGLPFIHYTDPQLQRLQIMECTKEQMELAAEVDALEMSRMDCYIAVRGSDNIAELSDVPAERMALYEKYYPGAPQGPGTQNPVGGTALSKRRHGPAVRDKHGGV